AHGNRATADARRRAQELVFELPSTARRGRDVARSEHGGILLSRWELGPVSSPRVGGAPSRLVSSSRCNDGSAHRRDLPGGDNLRSAAVQGAAGGNYVSATPKKLALVLSSVRSQ